MDKFLITIFALFFLASCGEVKVSEPYNYTVISIDSLRQMAADKYESAPEEAIEIYKEISNRSTTIKDYKKSARANFNIAQVYNEQLSDYGNAIDYSLLSVQDWQAVNDPQQTATVLNYLGQLQGRVNNFSEAEKNLNKAITLYSQLEDEKGLADTHLHLARIKLKAKEHDAAMEHYKQAKTFWKEDGDKKRIFESNLVGIDLYKHFGKKDQAKNLINENIGIARSTEIDKTLLDKFETQVAVEDK